MAWYPDAIRQQLTVPRRAREKVRMARPVRINFHTAVSNSTSIFPFFNSSGARGIFSHFYVGKTGQIYQYQDTAYTAACDLDGNPDTISIETWDGYRTGYPGYWRHDTDVPPWNAAQVRALTALAEWIVATHPSIPTRMAKDNRRGPSSHGFSWHRLGVVGAPGFVSRTNGGLTYSLARGKVCPGTRRTGQLPSILAAVTSKGSAPAGPATTPTPTPGGLTVSDITTLQAENAELRRILTDPATGIQAQLRAIAQGANSRDRMNRDDVAVAEIVQAATTAQTRVILDAVNRDGALSQADLDAVQERAAAAVRQGISEAVQSVEATVTLKAAR